jgi:hypothetical protein
VPEFRWCCLVGPARPGSGRLWHTIGHTLRVLLRRVGTIWHVFGIEGAAFLPASFQVDWATVATSAVVAAVVSGLFTLSNGWRDRVFRREERKLDREHEARMRELDRDWQERNFWRDRGLSDEEERKKRMGL